jgi:phage gp36-like protein
VAYASKQDMIERYGTDPLVELTDRAQPYTGAIVDAVLDRALSDAGAVIDSYISARYALPLDPVPVVLVPHACALAWHALHRDRRPDEVRQAYEDAFAFLRALSDGRARLDVSGTQPPSAPADARVEGPERIFSRTSMTEY